MIKRREFLLGGLAATGYVVLHPSLTLAAHLSSSSTKKKLTLAWDPLQHLHNLDGHVESPLRVKVTRELLIHQKIWEQSQIRELKEISEQVLRLGHTAEYIQYVRNSCQHKAPGYLENEKWSAYFGRHSYEVAARAATGLANLSLDVWEGRTPRGFALLRPPGHHATADHSRGYCIFNNVALAALHLHAKSKGPARTAIVDLDAHHGNGVQEMTQALPYILYISTHQKDWFPWSGKIDETGVGAGKGTVMNLPLPPHTGDHAYLQLMKSAILPKLHKFRPDFVLVCAGYDAHWRDPMASLGLSLKGIQELHRELITFADKNCGGKIVFALEGGYNIQALSNGVANTLALLDQREHREDPLGPAPFKEPDVSGIIAQARKIHSL